MEDVEMETEAEVGPSIKRLGVKNTIQTNFGDDYVFQIASNQEISTLAVSLSTNTIKLYSPRSSQYVGECKGHSGTINEISFSVPSSPHVLHSCSSDGTIRAWDTRTLQQVSILRASPSSEVFSFCLGGSSDNLLAAGCNAQILFWDLRNNKQVSCLEDSHMDDVTQVRFAPAYQNKLISASVDGLLCTFNTDGHINDDSHLESVMNVGTSISKVGFFGGTKQKLWCLTHIETLSVWDWKDARQEAIFQDARQSASDTWNLHHNLGFGQLSQLLSSRLSSALAAPLISLGPPVRKVDYFVDCHYSEDDDRMWVIGGTNTGTLGYFPVNYEGCGSIGSPEAILHGGHAGVVRTILPVSSINNIGCARSQGIFGWTGGEDGRLCCWLSDDASSEANRSWVSSSLVMKSPRTLGKNRHRPY